MVDNRRLLSIDCSTGHCVCIMLISSKTSFWTVDKNNSVIFGFPSLAFWSTGEPSETLEVKNYFIGRPHNNRRSTGSHSLIVFISKKIYETVTFYLSNFKHAHQDWNPMESIIPESFITNEIQKNSGIFTRNAFK